MSFERNQLPDAVSYYEGEGLRLIGPQSAKWKTTECRFHGGSDSMRVNVATGAFKCMNCGAGGGDVLAYHMHVHDMEFMEAARDLGAWIDDGKPLIDQKPTALPPRAALEVMAFEAMLVAVAAGNLASGHILSNIDLRRLLISAGRINRIVKDYVR